MIGRLKLLSAAFLVYLLMAAVPAQALETVKDSNPTPLPHETNPSSHSTAITGGITLQQNLDDDDLLLPGGFTANGKISDDECLNLADKGIFLVPDKEPFRYKFKCGNLVLFPDHDSVLTTAYGDICVPKNTIVLLLQKKDSLAVYDLSKDSFADVKIIRPKRTITLNPGMEFIIARSDYKTIQELPKLLTAVSYRGYVRSSLDHPSICAFTTRFSIASAFELMAPLNHLIKSKVERERHAFQQALKTFAVLINMDPDGAEFPNSSLDDANSV